MRPLYLIVGEMISELGGAEKIGPLLEVTANQAHKYGEDPESSGEPIPLERFLKLLTLSAPATHNTTLQSLIDEALQHFSAPANRKIVRQDVIDKLDRFLGALKDGGKWLPEETVIACPQCRNPMFLISNDKGTQVWQCRSCIGVKLSW